MPKNRRFGREQRRALQDAQRERKVQKEIGFYFDQVRYFQHRPPRDPNERELRQNEQKLFSRKMTAGINFDNYDDLPVERNGSGVDQYPELKDFDQLEGLTSWLKNNIRLCNYKRPTPVQRHTVPIALTGRDIMCCAQTGSGKTAAFLLPLIARMQARSNDRLDEAGASKPMSLVLAPTRELATQIYVEASKFFHRSPYRTVQVYGGASVPHQLTELAQGSDLVVATPGRLIDFIDRKVITMSAVGYLVLDEADRMLDMGFEPQIRRIVEQRGMPHSTDGRQTLMFSATFPDEMQQLAADFMKDYIWVGIGQVGGATENVTQRVRLLQRNQKLDELRSLFNEVPGRTLVFSETKKTADFLNYQISRYMGIRSAAIHGDLSQTERESSLRRFKDGQVRVLVATDVAARGLDIPQVTHVINYDLPSNIEDYVHRIGRTGRAGNTGLATAFFVVGVNENVQQQLYSCLKDGNQEVPDWLENIIKRSGYNHKKGGKKNRFGGQDHRGHSSGGYRSRGGGHHGGYRGGHRGRGRGRGRTYYPDKNPFYSGQQVHHQQGGNYRGGGAGGGYNRGYNPRNQGYQHHNNHYNKSYQNANSYNSSGDRGARYNNYGVHHQHPQHQQYDTSNIYQQAGSADGASGATGPSPGAGPGGPGATQIADGRTGPAATSTTTGNWVASTAGGMVPQAQHQQTGPPTIFYTQAPNGQMVPVQATGNIIAMPAGPGGAGPSGVHPGQYAAAHPQFMYQTTPNHPQFQHYAHAQQIHPSQYQAATPPQPTTNTSSTTSATVTGTEPSQQVNNLTNNMNALDIQAPGDGSDRQPQSGGLVGTDAEWEAAAANTRSGGAGRGRGRRQGRGRGRGRGTY